MLENYCSKYVLELCIDVYLTDQGIKSIYISNKFTASFSVSGTTNGLPQNGEALVGFHEDALTQAAMGKAQIMLALVLGLGLAAECSEVIILGYIMPAAELQLCIGEHRKGWLGTYKISIII